MSNHLMQPVEIDGIKYCLTENGRRTTLPLNTAFVASPTDLADLTDPAFWVCELVGVVSEFEISFGASCIDGFTLNVSNTTTSSSWVVLISIYADGVIIPGFEDVLYDSLIDGGEIGVSLDDLPCGQVVTVTVIQVDQDEEGVTTTIILSV